MSARQRRRLIMTGAIVSMVCAVAVAGAGLLMPVSVDKPSVAGPTGRSGQPGDDGGEATGGMTRPTLGQLQRVASLPLRAPLYDPVRPPDQQNTTTGKVPLRVRLIGTVTEAGNSMAMFQKPDGTIEICRIGETVDDPSGSVTVKQIELTKVVLEIGGRTIVQETPPQR